MVSIPSVEDAVESHRVYEHQDLAIDKPICFIARQGKACSLLLRLIL